MGTRGKGGREKTKERISNVTMRCFAMPDADAALLSALPKVLKPAMLKRFRVIQHGDSLEQVLSLPRPAPQAPGLWTVHPGPQPLADRQAGDAS